MDEKPKPLCMFCGEDESKGKMSREHFVPKCLWSGNRPEGTVTLPAHVSCNQAFSDDNDYFRMVLANDMGAEKNPQALGAVYGPIRRMSMWRIGQWRRYTADIATRPRFSETGLFLGNLTSFPIEMERMYRVVRNVTRGIYYMYRGKPILPSTVIKAHVVMGEDDPSVIFKENMIPWTGFGDDVFQCRVAMSSADNLIACLLKFYGYRHYFAMSYPP